jgi:hypothetical protein
MNKKILITIVSIIVLLVIAVLGYYWHLSKTETASKPQNLCGNGVCENLEDFKSCPTDCEETSSITQQELERGWYWGNQNQKKPGTPDDWIYEEAGRSSCWHKPGVKCRL